MLWLSLLILCLIRVAENAKILGIFPVPGSSHFLLGNSLMRALAEKGHDVTVISPFEDRNPTKRGSYKNVVLSGFLEEMEEQRKHVNFFESHSRNIVLRSSFMFLMMSRNTNSSLSHPNVQELIHSNVTFDVVIVEQFGNDAQKAFAMHFQAPLILFSAVGAVSWLNPLIGNPAPPSYVPEITLGYSPKMTFFQRVGNSLMRLYGNLIQHVYVYPTQSKMVQKYFPSESDLANTLYNASLVLLNSHISFTYPAPRVPNMIDIGGFHIKPTTKLPNDLQSYLDGAKEGAIYFSMGSMLRSKDLPEDKRDVFIKVFAKLKQNVLWKWEDDDLPGKPANVKTGKWLPQQEILAHPNVKLFITHAGLLSTAETVYHGVPILGIPIYGDQDFNAQMAANNGIGLVLNFGELTEENLTNKVVELLHNPKYRQNAKTRSAIFHDRQVKPIDEATYWVEYVIRHKGAPHLRVAGVDMPWYQYLLLDVIAVVTVFSIILLIVTFYIVRKICRKLICPRKERVEKIKKN